MKASDQSTEGFVLLDKHVPCVMTIHEAPLMDEMPAGDLLEYTVWFKNTGKVSGGYGNWNELMRVGEELRAIVVYQGKEILCPLPDDGSNFKNR